MFPKVDGMCSCGCGKPLTGKQKRWASEPCNTFATDIYFIICGYQGTVERFMLRYLGHKCSCGEIYGLELDHIVPVKHGGGGCWLNNYQWLCAKCHRLKTNKDFGFKP
jgi:5-methylcytosine-specific restriction endonuclease McrA